MHFSGIYEKLLFCNSYNVMYSKEQKVPIIIDFGMAYEIKSLYRGDQMNTVFFTHYEKYPPWCLEKLYIGSIVNKGQENQIQTHA